MAITSSFRIYWIYAILIFIALVFSLITNIFTFELGRVKVKKDSVIILLLIFFIPFVFTIIWPYIYDWLASDASRYHQTIFKTEQLYNRLDTGTGAEAGSSSSIRAGQFLFLYDNWTDFLLPQGFYDKVSSNTSPLRDGMYFYMASVFGLIISFFIFVRIIYSFYLGFSKSKDYKIIRFTVFVILISVFLTTGSVLLVISQSFFLGVLYSLQTTNYIE
jgi:hypothetical protein